jgi:hypothetical protein
VSPPDGVRCNPRVRFIADVHLGRLARYLRMAGFDVLYRNDFTDREIARIASETRRVVLTRDRGLLEHKRVTRFHWVRSVRPREQLREVLGRFGLADRARPFTRCLECNGRIVAVPKRKIEAELPPRTRTYYERFFRCAACRRVYWEGSHVERMARLLEEVRTGGS